MLVVFFYFSLLVNWEISLWWYMLDFPNHLNFDTQSCLWNSKDTSVHLWWGWWVSDAFPEGSYRMHLKTQKQTGSLPASLYNTEMFPAVAGSWSTLQDTWGAAISFLATQCAWKGDLRVKSDSNSNIILSLYHYSCGLEFLILIELDWLLKLHSNIHRIWREWPLTH